MRFSLKLGITLLATIAFGFLALFYFFYDTTSRTLEKEIHQRAQDNVFHAMDKLERFMFERLQDTKVIASSVPFKENPLDLEKITHRLLDYRNESREYASISFHDLSGKRLVDTSGLLIGTREDDRLFFKEALQKGTSAGTEVAVSISEKIPVAYFSCLVKGGDYRPIGVVAGRVPLYKLKDLVSQAMVIPDAQAARVELYLINDKNLVLYSTKKSVRPLKDYFTNPAVLQSLKAGKKSGTTALEGNAVYGKYFYTFAREAGCLDYKGNNWTLVLSVPQGYITGPLDRLKRKVTLVFVLALSLAGIFAVVLSRQLSRPLALLSQAIRKIGQGDLDAEIAYKKNDEFGQLAATFREMLARVKESKIKLEDYSRQLEEKVKERTLKLEESIARLTELDRLKSDFVSLVSHELRTPLTPIREAVSQIQEGILGPVNEKQVEFLDMALYNIDRLSLIVNDLLDMSRIEAGKMSLNKEAVSLDDLLENVTALFTQQAAAKGILIKKECARPMPMIYADKDRVIQVFTNLLNNALKFTEKGEITILLKADLDNIECRVSDTGRGIAPDDLPKMFSKFQQFGQYTGTPGAGLGLAISKSIVELHQGNIRVESELGRGTTFIVTLPGYRP